MKKIFLKVLLFLTIIVSICLYTNNNLDEEIKTIVVYNNMYHSNEVIEEYNQDLDLGIIIANNSFFQNKENANDIVIKSEYFNDIQSRNSTTFNDVTQASPTRNAYTKYLDVGVVSLTDDFVPDNKQELLNIIYTLMAIGTNSYDFSCGSKYSNCINDMLSIIKNADLLGNLNSLVGVYNSFDTINVAYNNLGKVSLSISRVYSASDIRKINNKLNQIESQVIDKSKDDYYNIKSIHDYIINNTKYNTGKTTSYDSTAMGPLFNGYAQCNGYTDLTALLLDRLNIKNVRIVTGSGVSEKHIWNLVYYNNLWLHLDVTWDDPVNMSNPSLNVLTYDNFLKTTEEDNNKHIFDKDFYYFVAASNKNVKYAIVTNIPTKYYTGKALTPKTSVKIGNKTLTENVDYKLSYANNKNVGTATVTITGIGDYTGTKKVTFKIVQGITLNKTSMNIFKGDTFKLNAKVVGNESVTYTSSNTNIATVSSTGLVTANDIGTTNIKVTTSSGKLATVKVTVVPIKAEKVTINSIGNMRYTGKKLKPSLTIKYLGKKLVLGKDYTLSYKKNVNPGTAIIRVTFKGDYTGTKEIKFIILPASNKITKVSKSGTGKLKVTFSASTGATGYQIAYKKKGSSKWQYATTKSLYVNLKNLNKSKYEIKVRPYITINNKNYYGTWSNIKYAILK